MCKKISTIVLVIMFSFFGKSKINAQEKLTGIIGKYYEDNNPVIVSFENKLPDNKIINSNPSLVVISWKYDGSMNNGMPLNSINEKMIILEDAFDEELKTSKIFYRAYGRTGNNLKELVYYCKNQESFMELLNKALEKHENYPIEITFYEDKDWSDLKNLISKFKK